MGIREKLLAAKVRTEAVSLPEIGEVVTVRGMTGVERDAFESGCLKGKGKNREVNLENMRAKLVAYCCVDEQGQRVFSDADVKALGEGPANLLDRLFAVAQRLSGMRDEDVDELGQPSETSTPFASSSLSSH